MGILDKLQKQGSNLTAFDGKTPNKYDETSGLVNADDQIVETDSRLDKDGKTPKKYLDNLPE